MRFPSPVPLALTPRDAALRARMHLAAVDGKPTCHAVRHQGQRRPIATRAVRFVYPPLAAELGGHAWPICDDCWGAGESAARRIGVDAWADVTADHPEFIARLNGGGTKAPAGYPNTPNGGNGAEKGAANR